MTVDKFGLKRGETPMRVLEYSSSVGKLMAQYGERHYRQLVLPTEVVIRGPIPRALDPTMYRIMRWSSSHHFWVDNKLMTYSQMVNHYVDAGKEFKGPWQERQPFLIEHWADCGDDGHTDWYHEGDALVLFKDKYASDKAFLGLVGEASGEDIQGWLHHAIDALTAGES